MFGSMFSKSEGKKEKAKKINTPVRKMESKSFLKEFSSSCYVPRHPEYSQYGEKRTCAHFHNHLEKCNPTISKDLFTGFLEPCRLKEVTLSFNIFHHMCNKSTSVPIHVGESRLLVRRRMRMA